MPAAAPPVVFLGPSLAAVEAARVLPADYRPPAARGDVVAAVLDRRPAAILLVDGVFGTVAAVRHAEILWAMSRGVPVLGAASMGALRAAELQPQGMIGIGLIYRWYRRTVLAPDDAVAVLHAPAELGCFPLTRALVDLRRSARRAERLGGVSPQIRKRFERAAAVLNFRDRSLEAVVAATVPAGDPDGRRALCQALERHWVPQKAVDALAAVRLLARPGVLGGWAAPRDPFVTTTAFVHDMAEIGLDVS